MEHFVTLFNANYIAQGLALHRSMERYIRSYTLWVLCMDEQTFDNLEQLSLENVRLLRLDELETESLLRAKAERSIAEYCWTLTPFTPRFVFEADSSVRRVTYLDADTWFCNSVLPIFREFDQSKKSVLITEHAYAPAFDLTTRSGRFCVQFMTFKRDGGERVRSWWEERCLEWCFARYEDGKLGDQKYLDDWEERFSDDVHILRDLNLILGPWNAIRFPYGRAVLWHFHGLKLFRWWKFILVTFGPYPIPGPTRKQIYGNYKKELLHSITLLKNHDVKPGFVQVTPWEIFFTALKRIYYSTRR